jgi:hypothetical protein
LLPILLNRQGAGLLVRPGCHLELPDPGIGATSGQDNKVGYPPQTEIKRNIDLKNVLSGFENANVRI